MERGSDRTVYLVDGSSYIYRAYFALPPLSTSHGIQTNAAYGFTTMLFKILREHQPAMVAVGFDEKGPTLRHRDFEAYKANRPEMPQGLETQIPLIHRIVEGFQLASVRMEGYEADDLLGTLARQAEAAGYEVVLVTGDKDMFQLLTPAVRLYDPVKEKWFGEEECRDRFGVPPAQVVEVMGLMGDATDNIPGVRGIGEKTAVKLIQEFGSIEAVLSRVEDVPSRVRTLLVDQADQARLSRSLATIHVDCPVTFEPERCRVRPLDPGRLLPLFRELEFSKLARYFQPDQAGAMPSPTPSRIHHEEDGRAFADLVRRCKVMGVHALVSDPKGVRSSLSAIVWSAGGKTVSLTPAHVPDLWPPSLRQLMADPEVVKAAHDLKPVLLACHRAGIPVGEPFFDTMIAAHLLNPNRRAHNLETVAFEGLGERLDPEPSLSPKKGGEDQATSLFGEADVPESGASETALGYAGAAASMVERLVTVLEQDMERYGLTTVFREVEMPLVPVLAKVERNGFCLDVPFLERLGRELGHELDRLMDRITNLAGVEFNINSPKQLAVVLFDKLGLTPLRKTKTGFSTDEDTLTQLAAHHDLPAEILNYRALSKLKSTYVEALPTLVNPETGRLHTSLHQTITATGRLSSSEPNLQNIPVKGEFGQRVREAFVAAPGSLLVSADYSQIEPRILAHLSQDERLLKVFQHQEDIHTATAVEIFHLRPEEITKQMRRIAKTVVFGILYGISPFGLASTLGVSQQEAKQYIDAYFARYPGVKAFLDETIEQARRSGYVTTILGRRRPVPELASQDPSQRGFGERIAVNTPIQGSAADLIKLAMIRVDRRLEHEVPDAKMILQIHDELIIECPAVDCEAVKAVVGPEMEGAGKTMGLSVPLHVDIGVGFNWRAAHL